MIADYQAIVYSGWMQTPPVRSLDVPAQETWNAAVDLMVTIIGTNPAGVKATVEKHYHLDGRCLWCEQWASYSRPANCSLAPLVGDAVAKISDAGKLTVQPRPCDAATPHDQHVWSRREVYRGRTRFPWHHCPGEDTEKDAPTTAA